MGSLFAGDISLLWSCLWQTTFCLLLGLGAGSLLARRPARAHYLLVIAILACFAAPVTSLVIRHLGWGIFVEKAPVVESRSFRPPPPAPTPAIAEPEPAAISSSPPPEPTLPKTERIEQRGTIVPLSIPYKSLLIWAWVFLSVLACVRLVCSLVKGIRIVNRARPVTDPEIQNAVTAVAQQLGLKRIPEAFISDHVAGPLIWCWRRRPALLLPSSISWPSSAVDFQSVLHHEFAHFRRRDHFAALLGELLACAVPWQPLAWWAKGRLGDLSEEACDHYALAAGASPRTYANLLVDLLPQPKSAFALATVTNRKNLHRRIRQIMANNRNAPNLGRWWSHGASVAAICLVAVIALAQAMPADSFFPLRGLEGEFVLGHGRLQQVAFSPDGKHFVTGGPAGMYLRDFATGEIIRAFLFRRSGLLRSLAFSPDGTKILAVHEN
ncbi:MAG: M56 family metallopeptidase, partial [bacterium]